MLTTPRLTLVPVGVDVARAVVAGDVSGVDAVPGWPHADTVDALRPVAQHGTPGALGTWFVRLRETGQVVGECGWYGPPGDTGEVEIGYGLAAPSRGQGYGTEAVRALVSWAAAQPGVRRVVASADLTNTASRRLLERLGFTVTEVGDTQARYVLPVRHLPR
jgi:RimJ/RimL family protein N-acetyltransferase